MRDSWGRLVGFVHVRINEEKVFELLYDDY